MDTTDAEMDMTPMVDVTFLLLIFFMITAAFSLQKSLAVPPTTDETRAASRTVDEFAEDSLIVRVDGDNVFWVSCPAWNEEKEAPSVQEMLIQLRQARRAGSGSGRSAPTTLLVLASPDATYEKVVAALDAGSDVGMEKVLLATAPDDQ